MMSVAAELGIAPDVEEDLQQELTRFERDFPQPELDDAISAQYRENPYARRAVDAFAKYTALWADIMAWFKDRNRNRLVRLIEAGTRLREVRAELQEAKTQQDSVRANLRENMREAGLTFHTAPRLFGGVQRMPVSPETVDLAIRERAGVLSDSQNPRHKLANAFRHIASQIVDIALSVVSGTILSYGYVTWSIMEPRDLIEEVKTNPIILVPMVLIGTVVSYGLGWVFASISKEWTKCRLMKQDHVGLGLLQLVLAAFGFVGWLSMVTLDKSAAMKFAEYVWRTNNPLATGRPEIGAEWIYWTIGALVASFYVAIKSIKGSLEGRKEAREEQRIITNQGKYEALRDTPETKAAVALASHSCELESRIQAARDEIKRQERIISKHQHTKWPAFWTIWALRKANYSFRRADVQAKAVLQVMPRLH